MKLCVSRSKNAASYYVAETYRKLNGRPATRIINKLGTEEELRKKLGPDVDITVWAKQHIKELTEQKNADNPIPIDVRIIPGQLYEKNDIRSFNVGYLVIQKMLYSLEFEELIKYISEKYSFDFDLEQIFSDLVCCRFIDPCSKKSSYAYAKENFLTPPKYDIHNVYRALDYIAKENDFIQSFLYKKSSSICARNTHVLFYDCTNFFFEIDDEDEFRKKGKSKENRTSPLVGMGMFIDGNGIPLGFSTYPGNEHDSTTLAPLEKRILKDFELAGAKLIICTDSGINSNDNMVLNSTMNRDFITIKSIKKMSEDDKSWVLDKGRSFKKDPIKPDENEQIAKKTFETNAWHDPETGKLISLEDIDEDDENNFEKVYYKEKECKDDKTGVEYRLIITYSIKYKRYMEHKKELDLKRAQKIIAKKKKKQIETDSSSSSIKYIKVTHTTEEGKKAENTVYEINKETIEEQSKYDGFYAVSTSLSHQEMPVKEIIKINKGRWQIEESFRILKSDFKSRPVFVRVKDRIQAHFIICFISLLVFRLMHRRINEIQAQKEEEVLKNNKDQEVADSQEIPNKMYTNSQIIRTLKNMRVTKVLSGYAGSFTSTGLTDILQSFLGETRFDCEYLEPSMLRRGIKNSKKRDIKKF